MIDFESEARKKEVEENVIILTLRTEVVVCLGVKINIERSIQNVRYLNYKERFSDLPMRMQPFDYPHFLNLIQMKTNTPAHTANGAGRFLVFHLFIIIFFLKIKTF